MKLLILVFVVFVAKISAHGFDAGDADEFYNEESVSHLKLVKPVGSVLHETVNVITIEENKLTGALEYNSWKPSSAEIQKAEDVLVDYKKFAVVRQGQQNGKSSLVGVMNGKKIEQNGTYEIVPEPQQPQYNHPDFIDHQENLTYFERNKTRTTPPMIVETLVVLDKEFADVFQHNRETILDYLTVYFWDMNMRFKTLPSVDISFRVTGVVIISTTKGQPFIEQVRESDGKADFNKVLPQFSSWVSDNLAKFPKFDLAITITNTKVVWAGGLAYMRFNCKNKGAGIFNDAGDWNSVTIGAHEIGHTLGAPHDSETKGCPESGYIMTGANDELKWFFSDCSDKYIKEYVTSDQAACLRRIDESSANPISSDFNGARPSSMDKQCKWRLGRDAFVKEEDTANCKRIRCLVPKEDGGWWVHSLNTADNSPCLGGGRCFRGRCRNPDYLIRNVGSGQCLKAPDAFKYRNRIELVDCPRYGTPLDRFAITDVSNGRMLGVPWQSVDAMENGDKCIYTGITDKAGLFTDRCDEGNIWHEWDFINLENHEFLLQHRVTKRCAKQVGNEIQTLKDCDKYDKNFRWKLK